MDISEDSRATSSARHVEHTEEVPANVSLHSDPDDAWDQKAKAQRKWAAKTSNRSALAHKSSPTAGRSSKPPSYLAGLQNDRTSEPLVEEIDFAPSPIARKDRATPTPMPTRRSADEVLEIPKSHPDQTSTTRELKSPVVDTQDHDLISDSVDDNNDDSDKKFVLSTRDQRQEIYNHGDTNIGGMANVVFGRAGNDVGHEHPEMQQNFGQLNFRGGSQGMFGNVNHYYSPALLGGLQALTSDATNDAAIRYRRSRASIQSVTNLPTMPMAYLPYASVSQPELKTALIKIAVVCQFLDAAFAEYFRTVISHLQGTRAKLLRLREQICSRQSNNVEYIGSFGEYCERINAIPQADMHPGVERYQARATGDEIQPYLQDALEVPYWDMMADQFIKSNHINNQFTYDAVLSVINDKRRELKLRLQQVKQKWLGSLPQEIKEGIARRISVLDALLAQTSDKYDSLEEQQVQALQRSPTSGLESASPSTGPMAPASAPLTAKASSVDDITDIEKVSLLSLFFLFTAISMVPFGMGFAGNWDADPSDAVGSTSDPDFKWLIATTLLAIFGNIYAVVPLLKITRGSTANVISQVFLYFSIALGIFSVSVYPFWNKARSSSLSFFCSFFAIGSVFISAQHTSDTALGKPADASKVKKE